MTDQDRTTRTRARTPGAEDDPSSKAVHWRMGDPTQRGTSQAEGRMQTERASVYVGSRLKPAAEIGKASSDSQPFSRTGENPPYGMLGGIKETPASFEARSAPGSYPTAGGAQK